MLPGNHCQSYYPGPVFCLLLGVSSDCLANHKAGYFRKPGLWLAEHSLSLLCARDRKWALRADSRFAPSQWVMPLLCNDVSHWLCANLESALGPGTLSCVLKSLRLIWKSTKSANARSSKELQITRYQDGCISNQWLQGDMPHWTWMLSNHSFAFPAIAE